MSHNSRVRLLQAITKTGLVIGNLGFPIGWETFLESSQNTTADDFIEVMEDTEGDIRQAVGMLRTEVGNTSSATPPPPTPPPSAPVPPPTPPRAATPPVTATQTLRAPVAPPPTAAPTATSTAPSAPPPPTPAPKKEEKKEEVKPAANGAKPVAPAAAAAPANCAPKAPPKPNWVEKLLGQLAFFTGGIALLVVLAAIGDSAFGEQASSVARSINGMLPQPNVSQSLIGQNVPYWNFHIFADAFGKWDLLPPAAQAAIVITGVYFAYIIFDIMSNRTRADFAGLVGLVVSVLAFGVQLPTGTLTWFVSGQFLNRRNRDEGAPMWAVPAIGVAMTLFFWWLQRSYMTLATDKLLATLGRILGLLIFSLTPENMWVILYIIEIGFTLSYFVDKKVDGSSQAGIHMIQATIALAGTYIPFTMLQSTGYALAFSVATAYALINFGIAISLEMRETYVRMKKEGIAHATETAMFIAVCYFAIVIFVAWAFQKGFDMKLLWASLLALTITGALPGIMLSAIRLAKGQAVYESTITTIELVMGDIQHFWVLFYPACVNIFILLLWIYSFITNSKPF